MNKWTLLLVATVVCAPGSYVYKDTCVVDIQPQTDPAVQPSNEKVPSDKMPSWQREGIVLINAPNMEQDDRKQDQERAEADAQGKQAAGLKPKL